MKKNYFLKKAFTLVEVMVSLVISGIVIFFIYTIMIYSYEAYKKLGSAVENSNDIDILVSSLSDSAKYCYKVEKTPNGLKFYKRAVSDGASVIEEYRMGGAFVDDVTKATQTIAKPDPIGTSIGSTRYVVYKYVQRVGDKSEKSVHMLHNSVKNIYYHITNSNSKVAYQKINFGIAYDYVLNGEKGDSGDLKVVDGVTNISTKKIYFCVTSRGV